MTLFDTIEQLPDDPIFGLIPLFNADTDQKKINLSVGVYKDSFGNVPVFSSVREAESIILKKELSKNYQPIDGDPSYCKETEKLIFGKSVEKVVDGGIYTAQTVGASGALRIGAELLAQTGIKEIATSAPTWSNHYALLGKGGLKLLQYHYYDEQTKSVDFEKMSLSIKQLPEKSAILLQCCCHNPTGIDLSKKQWEELSQLLKKRQITPFFDFAYHGFKESIDQDSLPIQIFVEDGHQVLVAYSYSKNMGLYGERAGALSIVTHDKQESLKVKSHVKTIIRANYSSPALQSARIVSTVLQDPNLKKKWLQELASMRERVIHLRLMLVDKLGKEFDFINNQSGMFGLIGLSLASVKQLREEFSIYMPDSGRMNIVGLNETNMNHFVFALKKVLNLS